MEFNHFIKFRAEGRTEEEVTIVTVTVFKNNALSLFSLIL